MVVKPGYDFAGYATKNDILCSDGRTIRRNAFREQHGMTVPMVWNHGHDDPGNVIGHALLENRDDGVYAYCYLNDTEKGLNAKKIVNHGDVKSLSIFANHLKQKAGDVLHGKIRELSLVLAGANEGAEINWFPGLAHSDSPDDDGDSFILYGGYEDMYIAHKAKDPDEEDDEDEKDPEEPDDEDDEKDPDDEDSKDEDDDMEDEKKKNIKHADDEADTSKKTGSEDGDDGETVQDVIDSMNEKQKKVMYALVGAAAEGKGNDDSEEDDDMKHSVFDDATQTNNYLSHADQEKIINDARKSGGTGSLKQAFIAHCEAMNIDEDDVLQHDDVAQRYGIDHIEALFPEYKNLNVPPEWIKRDTTWVPKVLNGAHHVPFARIKSMFANLTEDEARAKGYIKGNMKKEQVFSLLKRTTDPQTIYKKQKLDRDDQIDITDFNVVAWIKSEMRGQLDEEIARAMLVGDGRLTSDDDHISEDHIRPIWKDADLFAVKVTITMKQGATDDDKARAFIRACIKARKRYKGSGNPSMFTTEDFISDCLLLEDGIGHSLYDTEQALATKCRVKEIVAVEIMEGLTDSTTGDLAAIIVNMTDYNVGADKGGAVAMFEDFDIDFNQNKYLIETRCSGALVKPYSAIVISIKQGSGNNTTISFSGDGMDEFAIKDEDDTQG